MADTYPTQFPSNELEALAMLYVQSQDLTDASPEDLYDMYQDAYQKIRDHHRAEREKSREHFGWY